MALNELASCSTLKGEYRNLPNRGAGRDSKVKEVENVSNNFAQNTGSPKLWGAPLLGVAPIIGRIR